MKLTLQTDYGLRVLLYLALRPTDVVPVREIAAAYGISENHLMKVAQLLGRTGYVEMLRGVHGGVRLAHTPESVRLGDVVRAIEPNLALVECFDSETSTCAITSTCALKGILLKAQRAFFAELDARTLADVVAKPQALRSILVSQQALTAKRAR